jgi:hypothetical protein
MSSPALDTTTGIIIGAVIAGVGALFLIVFGISNCKSGDREGYSKLSVQDTD